MTQRHEPAIRSLGAGEHSKPYDLKQRTKQFALRTVRLVKALPKDSAAQVIGRQLLRSATSAGANCRAAHRGRSRREYMAKMGIVEEELDESLYWMELLIETGTMKRERLEKLIQEADELTAIVVTCIRRTRMKK